MLLIISGNLSFLNWLTIVPSIACFDDVSLGFLFSSRRGGVKERVVQMQLEEAAGKQLPLGELFPEAGKNCTEVCLVCLSQKLSSPSGANLGGQGEDSAPAWSPLWVGRCPDLALRMVSVKPVAGS